MDVRLLGPVSVRSRGRAVELGPAKQRAVLAILAAEANRPVTRDVLEARVWGDGLPTQARKTLHSYLTRLRRVLADVDGIELRRRDGGYVLAVEPRAVDLVRFREYVARARGDGTAENWEAAVAQWRGEAFEGLDVPGLNRLRRELTIERELAELERNDAFIAAGRLRELLPGLTKRCRQAPLDERLAAQLVTVLHGLGRGADALGHYRATRALLVERLGQEPGRVLRQAQRRVLADQPDEDPEASAVPRQLPADTSAFTGRQRLVARVVELLRGGDSGSAAAVVSIDGMGGAGKTALAVRAATTVAAQYPDGQLFIDLRGYSGTTAVTPFDALDVLLRSLGVAGQRLPSQLAARSALLRSQLARRRVLVVLDNAADEAQVLPLLPGASGSAVLMTSRRRLTGVDDAVAVTVEELTSAEAVALFGRVSGRVEAPEPVAEVVELCGRLPLAVRIAAARLRARPHWSIGGLRDRLRDERRRLTELRVGNRDVAAVFALSLADLGERARECFVALGLVPGPDFGVEAVAAVAGDEAAWALDELVDAHLVRSLPGERYDLHDLVRLFARERAEVEYRSAERAAASARLRQWCLAGATAATARARLSGVAEREGASAESTADEVATGLAWLDAERAGIVAVIRAGDDDVATPPWRLVNSVAQFLQFRGDFATLAEIAAIAERAARRDGDRLGVAWSRFRAGTAAQGRSDTASMLEHSREALRRLRDGDDPGLVVAVHNQLALGHSRLGSVDDATVHVLLGLDLYRRTGGDWGAGILLTAANLAVYRGELTEALARFAEALAPLRRGDTVNLCVALVNLAAMYVEVGDPAGAEPYFAEADELITGERLNFATAPLSRQRARARLVAGDRTGAADAARHALTVAREAGDRGEEGAALAVLALAVPEPDEAVRLAWAAVSIAVELGDLAARLTAAVSLAESLLARGQTAAAADTARAGLELAREHHRVRAEADLLTVLAACRMAAADRRGATDDARRALALHLASGHRPGADRCRRLLATAED